MAMKRHVNLKFFLKGDKDLMRIILNVMAADIMYDSTHPPQTLHLPIIIIICQYYCGTHQVSQWEIKFNGLSQRADSKKSAKMIQIWYQS